MEEADDWNGAMTAMNPAWLQSLSNTGVNYANAKAGSTSYSAAGLAGAGPLGVAK